MAEIKPQLAKFGQGSVRIQVAIYMITSVERTKKKKKTHRKKNLAYRQERPKKERKPNELLYNNNSLEHLFDAHSHVLVQYFTISFANSDSRTDIHFSHKGKIAYLNQTEEARIIFINYLRVNKPPHENGLF